MASRRARPSWAPAFRPRMLLGVRGGSRDFARVQRRRSVPLSASRLRQHAQRQKMPPDIGVPAERGGVDHDDLSQGCAEIWLEVPK
jgi:hypothetical protein